MPADQPGREGQEVPLGARRREHVSGADAEAVEDQGELVHQRDVEVALRVLDDLGGLGDLDARGPVDAGRDDPPYTAATRSSVSASWPDDDLDDASDGVLAVAGVDALRRVAEGEIPSGTQAGRSFEDGPQISSVTPG